MRKGFTLVEILVVIVVLPFIAIVLDKLFVNVVRDIPKQSRVLDKDTTVLHMLNRMQNDMDNAKSLPDSFGKQVAGDDLLLIKLKSGVISYELKNGKVLRRGIDGTDSVESNGVTAWEIPDADIKWHRWKKGSNAYAVEVETYIEHKLRNKTQKKMANTHVYFLNAL